MKSKKIISEVAKIRSLFDYRRGVVISEQGRDVQSDVAAIRKEIQRFNSDEQDIVNILTQYTTKDEFQKFVDTYKQTNNIDFGTDLARALQPSRDKKEWDELTTSLQKLGVTMGLTTVDDGRVPYISFQGLKSPYAPTRSKIISGLFCSVKNGKIVSPDTQMNNVTWDAFTKTYKPTPQELADAAKSCPDAELSKKQTATQFTKNENFPLKFQQQGEKIKQLQTALDVRNKANQPNITGKFWTATENAVKAKAAELGLTYDRSKGVDEQMFNKFMEAYNTGVGSFKPKEQTGGLPSTARAVPTTATGSLPSTAGTLPSTGTAPVGPNP